MIQQKADVDAVQENSGDMDTEDERRLKEKDGRTPLHSAVYGGHEAIVRLLLEHDADPSLKDIHGRRPEDVTEDAAIKRLFAIYGREKQGDD